MRGNELIRRVVTIVVAYVFTAAFLGLPHLPQLGMQPATVMAAAPTCVATAEPNIAAIAGAVSNNGKGPFITDLNQLSTAAWCTFLWLNWPQEAKPKAGDCLNVAGGNTCQVRWQTWLPSTSVYCSDGSAPNPVTGCVNNPKSAIRMLRAGSNPGPRFSSSPPTAPLGPLQPTGFGLPDKNNSSTNPSLIFYESVEEPSLVKFVIQNKLYNLDGQQALYNSLNLKGAPGTAGRPPAPGLPSGLSATPLDFPVTAFEVKPSWYASNGTELQSLGMINALGVPPIKISSCQNNPCNVGLTGFHILWKVFPKSPWFWATFEFDNSGGSAKTPGSNLTLAPMLTAAQPNANLPQSATNVSKTGPYVPYDAVTQSDPMSKAAAQSTATFKKILAGTSLANYKLVGVQVAATLDGTPTGPVSYLANNHLETDFGAVKIGNNAVNRGSSCIACHYNASIGSTNTTECKYDSTGKYQTGTAYFRRVPIYLRNQDAVAPFTNKNGEPPCSAYSDANGNPTGYTHFLPSTFSHACESKGSFVGTDFVWSIQEATWAKGGTNGCPATRPPAQ